MKTFDQFIKDWNGKPVDTDGAFGAQCMDAMHKYKTEVLGITDFLTLAAPQARLVYENFNNIKGHELFERIPNTPTGVPIKGDIFFFGKGVGPDGHVCMFIEGNVNSFRSFDQNWAGKKYCTIVTHNYNGALGWLRYKGQPMTCDQKIEKVKQILLKNGTTDTQKVIDSKYVLGV